MGLKILIVGAGVTGPVLALLLQYHSPTNHITILERAASLRDTGLQLDLKGQATPLMQRLGLYEEMKKYRVHESGSMMVGGKGECLAQFGIEDGVTEEVEIMRGDMVKVVVDAGKRMRQEAESRGVQEGGLKYVFGKTVKSLVQDGEGVDVTFEDGTEGRFDLVVGCDGQNSRTRRQLLGEEAEKEAVRNLGTNVAYFTIPRGAKDDEVMKMCISTKKRGIMVRNGGRPETQIYLFANSNADKIEKAHTKSMVEQKSVWSETFQGAGWDTERFLAGMQTTKNFYTHQLVQVKLPTLYKGRVVLVGDAGYCPSVLSGYGTTAGFIGAYLLAGELAKHSTDIDAALKAYDEIMKVPIEKAQRIGPHGDVVNSLPNSSFALWLYRSSIWAMSTLKIDKLMAKIKPEKKDPTTLEEWPMPEYPELKLGQL